MKYQQKCHARQLYLQSELSVTEIATRIGVSRRSIQLWTKDGNWDAIKDSVEELDNKLSQTSARFIADYTDHLISRGNDAPVTSLDIDVLFKTVSVVARLNEKITRGNVTPAKKLRKNLQLTNW